MFSQIKDTKISNMIFVRSPWSCPRGGTWGGGGWGCPGGQKFTFFEHGHVADHIDRDDEQNKMQVQVSLVSICRVTTQVRLSSYSTNLPWLPKFNKFFFRKNLSSIQIAVY